MLLYKSGNSIRVFFKGIFCVVYYWYNRYIDIFAEKIATISLRMLLGEGIRSLCDALLVVYFDNSDGQVVDEGKC